MSTQETKLKAIADAIREKEGSTALIPAKDFPARILALETGGLPEGIRTISAEPNVTSRGDVSGGGMASDGTRIMVRAAAKGGYKFANWTENGSSVSTEADYAFDVTKDRNLTAVFNVKPASRLPAGYTEVEYIMTDNLCAIDTKFYGNLNTTRIVMIVKELSYTGFSDGEVLFSGRGYVSPNYYFSNVWLHSATQIGWREASTTFQTKTIDYKEKDFLIDYNCPAKTLTLGDSTATLKTANYSLSNISLHIGCFSTIDTTRSARFALKSFKVYTGTSIQRDFVPCINPSGIVGVYDLTGKTFYQNSKSGVLTAGPAV